jgi:hypothetical protein
MPFMSRGSRVGRACVGVVSRHTAVDPCNGCGPRGSGAPASQKGERGRGYCNQKQEESQ